MFLAADSFQARLVFNAVVHQYLIPGIQVGAKVRANAQTGSILDIYAVERPVTPDVGCLWCNELIPPRRLQEEAATRVERSAQAYVEDADVAAPSVVTLNALGAAQASNDFLFMVTGLLVDDVDLGYRKLSAAAPSDGARYSASRQLLHRVRIGSAQPPCSRGFRTAADPLLSFGR